MAPAVNKVFFNLTETFPKINKWGGDILIMYNLQYKKFHMELKISLLH